MARRSTWRTGELRLLSMERQGNWFSRLAEFFGDSDDSVLPDHIIIIIIITDQDTHLEDAGEISCKTNKDSSSCQLKVACEFKRSLWTMKRKLKEKNYRCLPRCKWFCESNGAVRWRCWARAGALPSSAPQMIYFLTIYSTKMAPRCYFEQPGCLSCGGEGPRRASWLLHQRQKGKDFRQAELDDHWNWHLNFSDIISKVSKNDDRCEYVNLGEGKHQLIIHKVSLK